MLSIKLILVIIVLTLILISFIKNVKRNEKAIKKLLNECDKICLEIEEIDMSNKDSCILKLNKLNVEKAILIDKLIDHGHFYEYVPNRKQ